MACAIAPSADSYVLDESDLSDDQMLREYKAQQSTERGFRFLKDPLFLIDCHRAIKKFEVSDRYLRNVGFKGG